MKKIVLSIIFTIPVFCISREPAYPGQEERIRQEINNVKSSIREIIARSPEAQNYIIQIKNTLGKMRELENNAGITPLHQQLAQARYEACIAQQKNGDVQKLLKKVKQLNRTISEKTTEERRKVSQLTKKLNNTLEKSKTGELKAQIKKIETVMKQKTKPQLREINSINTKIKKLMGETIQDARPIADSIRKKYKPLRNQIKQLDHQISQAVDQVNQLIGSNYDILQQKRSQLFKLRHKLREIQPCAKPDEQEARWEEFFM